MKRNGKSCNSLNCRTWKLADGFLFGGGLIITGLMLQLSIGPVDWSLFEWPANIIVLAVLLAFIGGMFLLRKRVYAFQFMGTYTAAVPALIYASVLTVILGLTRQQTNGSWLSAMLSFWPFVLIYTYVAIILGLVILRQIRTAVAARPWSLVPKVSRNFSFFTLPFSLLSHLGLFIALVTATLGNADIKKMTMVVYLNDLTGYPEYTALDHKTNTFVVMPLAIQLDKFIMELYDNGSPKRYASEVVIYSQKTRSTYKTTIDVNKPAEVDGWTIYQTGYDQQLGPWSPYSIFELVRDPWLPYVYVGIYMMIAGAILMLVFAKSTTRWKLLCIVMIAAYVLGIVIFKCIVHTRSLIPALQSPWLVPHVVAYLFAYALLGASFLMAVWTLIREKGKVNSEKFASATESGHTAKLDKADNLVYIGLAFMTVGMLFGALWAKEAWGHYWSWDPKETWAAASWLGYLCYVHYRLYPKHSSRTALWLLIVCFVLLQMCWWGINYLPSAQGGASVHTYGS